ncbi:MAG: hypothetical protein ABI882_19385 [Acidobacteriota bacterium]
MIWLGAKRGYLTDWFTQRWVELTGTRVDLGLARWLEAPVGKPAGIGRDFFDVLARESNLKVRRAGPGEGLVDDFSRLSGPGFDPARVHAQVITFYEQTAGYELDAWAEWSAAFRPFGSLLAVLFSRRLQQLNVPLSALDTSRGMTSEVIKLQHPETGEVRYTAWVRTLVSRGDVVYAGNYSVCSIPGYDGPCVKVAFPLPNGNAIVIMRPQAHEDGSLSITSSGERLGDPGFYLTVHGERGAVWVRYVRTMRERIHVYAGENGEVRADHLLTLWGSTFLRIHYRLRLRKVERHLSQT